MGDTGDDVSYIADLINGSESDANAQGGRRARRSRRVSTQARDTTQRASADQGLQNNRGSFNRHVTVPLPSSQAKDLTVRMYNKPSDKSTDKVYHCSTCDVWVPSRSGDWEVHIAGIRHRRHVLSLREHGERGRVVLSAFESDPRPGEMSHRISGKASPAEFGFDQGASSSGLPRKQREEGKKRGAGQQDLRLKNNKTRHMWDTDSVRSMITKAKSLVLGIYGQGRIYNACIDHIFTRNNLWCAEFENFESFRSRISSTSKLPSLDATRNKISSCWCDFQDPASLLCMAYTLKKGTWKQHLNNRCDTGNAYYEKEKHTLEELRLPPVVVLELENPDRNEDYCSAYIAAWLCSLQSFVHALAENPGQVVRLILIIPRDLSVHLRETFHKGWDRVLSDIENVLLAKNAKLKEIRIYLVRPNFDNRQGLLRAAATNEIVAEEVDRFVDEKVDQACPKFVKKAKETAAKKRLAILMSQHPRLGRCSLLQLLPEPALRGIVEEAVPKQGCDIFVDSSFFTPPLYFTPGEWTVHEEELPEELF